MLYNFLKNLNTKNFIAETNGNNAEKPVYLRAADFLGKFRSINICKNKSPKANRLLFQKTRASRRPNEQNGKTFFDGFERALCNQASFSNLAISLGVNRVADTFQLFYF